MMMMSVIASCVCCYLKRFGMVPVEREITTSKENVRERKRRQGKWGMMRMNSFNSCYYLLRFLSSLIAPTIEN